MKNSQYLLMSLLTLATMNFACAPSNPRREAPLEVNTPVETLADGHDEVEVNSQLDVMFVVDDSNSMGKHQSNFARYASEFVKSFAKNATLDFHIGITKAYDSEILMRFEQGRTSRQVNIAPAGHLLPLKAPKGSKISLEGQPHYISKATPDYLKVLQASLIVCDTPECPKDGPVFEEFFSAVEKAFEPEALNGPNAGFFRPKAHLAIIFVTDSEDSTKGISADSLHKKLVALKGGDENLISYHGLLVPVISENCARDNGKLAPIKIEQLLRHSNSRPISLCSQKFGQDVAELGLNLSKRIDRKVIPLKYIPDFSAEMKVSYGIPGGTQQEIKQDESTGWTYIPAGKPRGPAILLGEKLDVQYQEGAKLSIKATPLNLANRKTGRIKKY